MIRQIFVCLFLASCASTVAQDPPNDPATIPDASTDAPIEKDAGSTIIGRACTTDADCGGGEIRCQLTAPGGYCTLMCVGDADCPDGSICAPMPLSRVTGVCMQSCTDATECRTDYVCGIVHLFPGDPNAPASASPVCWESPDAGP